MATEPLTYGHGADRGHREGVPVWRSQGGRFVRLVGPPLILMFLAALRWRSAVVSRDLLVDEQVYLAAFRAVASGESPYVVRDYFYSPAFAVFGAWLIDFASSITVAGAMRTANLLGAALTFWLPFTLLDIPSYRRLALAAAALLLAPGARLAMEAGNLSLAAIALVFVALLGWQRLPRSAGLLLGVSFVTKPLALLALPVLAAHRPREGGRAHLTAAAASVVGAGLLLAGVRHLPEFLTLGSSLDTESFPLVRTASTHRLLFNLGLDVGRIWITLAIGFAALVLVRLREWSREDLLCLIVTAVVLAAPVLWTHTLLLTLPLQVMAIRRVIDRWSEARAVRRSASSTFRPWESAAVIVAVLAVHFSDGIGSVGPGPSISVAFAVAPPLLATAGLAAFVVCTAPKEGGPSTAQRRPADTALGGS